MTATEQTKEKRNISKPKWTTATSSASAERKAQQDAGNADYDTQIMNQR